MLTSLLISAQRSRAIVKFDSHLLPPHTNSTEIFKFLTTHHSRHIQAENMWNLRRVENQLFLIELTFDDRKRDYMRLWRNSIIINHENKKQSHTYLTFVATCDPCGCALWWSCVSYIVIRKLFILYSHHILNKIFTLARFQNHAADAASLARIYS